jgi:peptidoglycan/xylan/chitin deacetylase (PgdA/CDA1 family)
MTLSGKLISEADRKNDAKDGYDKTVSQRRRLRASRTTNTRREEKMTIARNLIGYGRKRPDILWPNGARVAVSITVNFEEGAELSIEAGDAETERFGEAPSVQPPGVRDLPQEQIFDYGMRVGFWRFLDILDRHKMPVTIQMCGRAVERAPELARLAVEAGHEPLAHGWRWLPHSRYSERETEKKDILRTRDAIQRVTGVAPQGFFSRGGQSPWTRDLLAELGFLHDSNALDDELPYWAQCSEGRRILVLPYCFDTNDMRYWYPNGFIRPDDFAAYTLAAVDTLIQEAELGRSSMLTIGLHLRISGRPARFAAVRQILAGLSAVSGKVWIATRGQIAGHFSTQVNEIPLVA